MRILLPPSESKRSGGRGLSLQRRATVSKFDAARRSAIAALASVCESSEAAATLLLPASVAQAALSHNRTVLTSPTLPALRRYSGVLYDGLAVSSFSPAQLRLANSTILIFSGLFGVLRANEPVPAYRVPAKAVLGELGVVGTYWRKQLASLVPGLLDDGLIIDLRSSDYRAMWLPTRSSEVSLRHLSVRILSRRPGGQLGVISYDSKFGKGRLAAALLDRSARGLPLDPPKTSSPPGSQSRAPMPEQDVTVNWN